IQLRSRYTGRTENGAGADLGRGRRGGGGTRHAGLPVVLPRPAGARAGQPAAHADARGGPRRGRRPARLGGALGPRAGGRRVPPRGAARGGRRRGRRGGRQSAARPLLGGVPRLVGRRGGSGRSGAPLGTSTPIAVAEPDGELDRIAQRGCGSCRHQALAPRVLPADASHSALAGASSTKRQLHMAQARRGACLRECRRAARCPHCARPLPIPLPPPRPPRPHRGCARSRPPPAAIVQGAPPLPLHSASFCSSRGRGGGPPGSVGGVRLPLPPAQVWGGKRLA
ncbi:unnamed protein product, partial [Prorocentrum cordatum]